MATHFFQLNDGYSFGLYEISQASYLCNLVCYVFADVLLHSLAQGGTRMDWDFGFLCCYGLHHGAIGIAKD